MKRALIALTMLPIILFLVGLFIIDLDFTQEPVFGYLSGVAIGLFVSLLIIADKI